MNGNNGNKSKLLWHSNAPFAPTGYGNQTGLFAPLLADHYDLGMSAFYGLHGAPIVWNGIPVFPGLGDTFGNECLVGHATNHFGGDPRGGMVATLLDVWVLDPEMAAQLNMVCWVPVDHEPAPPGVVEFLQRSGAVPVAMSRFGEQQLAELDPLYCPHGVDTEVYRPVGRLDTIPDGAFLVGMVAANKGRPSRKGFQQALQAFRLFLEDHDDAYLYLHTVLDPRLAPDGENLAALVRGLGLPPDRVLLADQYEMLYDPHPPSTMAKLYSSLDVLLNPSLGEGFGIPVLEAAACGIPSIVTNFSAMPEVAGDAGWRVGCRPFWTGQGSWQMTPDVAEIAEALEACYGMSRAEKEKRAVMAREHALTYDVRRVFEEHMLPALEAAKRRFDDRRPVELSGKVAA